MILASLVLAAAAAAAPVISAEPIREDVRVLASDEFEGSDSGEVHDCKTVDMAAASTSAQ